MFASKFVLSFEPNTKCINLIKKKNGTIVRCNTKLNSVPGKYGGERYCSKCINKSKIVEILEKERGDPCMSSTCNISAKKVVKDKVLDYGEDRYCYTCLHSLEIQKRLGWEREQKGIKLPEPEEIDWLNTVVFTQENITALHDGDKGICRGLEGGVPDHMRYMMDVFLKGDPVSEAKLLIWINEHSVEAIIFDLEDENILREQVSSIRQNSINRLIAKLSLILFRNHDIHFQCERTAILDRFKLLNKDILIKYQRAGKEKVSYSFEDTFNFIVKLLEYNSLEMFIEEQIDITDNPKDRLKTNEIYERYLEWVENNGKESLYGGSNIMGKELRKYVDEHKKWEMKDIHGIKVHCGIKFKNP